MYVHQIQHIQTTRVPIIKKKFPYFNVLVACLTVSPYFLLPARNYRTTVALPYFECYVRNIGRGRE